MEEDRTGILEDICRVFKEQDVSIANMAVYNSSRGIEIVVIVHGFDDITDKLEKAGYKVTSVMKLNEK